MATLTRTIFSLTAFLLGVVVFISCGGGGGSDSSTSGESNKAGAVALYLTDAPSDDYDHIWIWIKDVSLMSSDDETQIHLFESEEPEGFKLDLLDLYNQDFLLTLNEAVAAGSYAKIRLEIADIQPEGGTGSCSDFEVKLPSGKIDLVPDPPFEVVSGETLAIRLDIDAEKSINLHEAGNSGKCIFRPVVFADIDTQAAPLAICPQQVTGVLQDITYDGDDETIIGFSMDLDDGRGELEIVFAESVSLFDAGGLPVPSVSFEEGGTVFVRGGLNSGNQFEASLAVVGGVESFAGTTTQDSSLDTMTVVLKDGSGELTVSLTSGTTITGDCNDPFTEDVIPQNTSVKVFGKFSGGTANSFQAVLVLVES